jgi:DNA-binding SARP family transcriptional activator
MALFVLLSICSLKKMTEMLHIQLLGDFCLRRGDEDVTTVQSAQEQSLLAYLLLHRESPQSRQHVSFLFWPDATEARARNQLRKVLFRLRQDLPDADTFLHTDAQTMQWRMDAPFELDVAEFERGLALAGQLEASGHRREAISLLEEALALYQGSLLPSCYDNWIRPERERLSQRFVQASEDLLALLEVQRAYMRAIEAAQRLLRHDPLHEPGYRSLMRLYALTGNRASALRVYHTCTTNLEEELGVEPDLDTRQVYERLLHTDVHVKPIASPMPDLAASLPLVGRHRDWAQLLSIWQRAVVGVSQVILLEGVAGIGKTRLAEELGRWVRRQGHTALTARCYAAEGKLAYGPVVQWLRARSLPSLEPVWRRELARLLPELLDDVSDGESLSPMTEAWQRQRLFEALARAVLEEQSSLLLILDDAQWCDQETLAWLHYLLRFDLSARMLIVATLRLEEFDVDHPLSAWVRAAQRSVPVHELVLGPLSEEETLALAAKVAGRGLDDEMAACIFKETEGNPLFVVEMVRAGKVGGAQDLVCPLQEGLPAKVQATIEGRLALLSPAAQALVNIAAVVGREFTFEVLMQASDLDHDTALRALDELWQRRIVREQDETGYDFTHDKLRQVAYASLTEAHRRYLHRNVAAALETVFSANLDTVSGLVAVHYERAGDPQRALPHLLRAADYALHVYANEEATKYYDRVLKMITPPANTEQVKWRFQALSALGQIALRMGQHSVAEGHIRQALKVGKTISCPTQSLARLYHWLEQALFGQARYAERQQVAEEAVASLGEALNPLEKALIQDSMFFGYPLAENTDKSRELWYQAVAFAENSPYSEELSTAYLKASSLHVYAKEVDEAQRLLHLLETKAALHADERAMGFVHQRTAELLARQGDVSGALVALSQALACAERSKDFRDRAFYMWRLSFRFLMIGDIPKAVETARTNLHNVQVELVYRYSLIWSNWLLGAVLLCQDAGQRQAIDYLEQALTAATKYGNFEIIILSHLGLGWLYLSQHKFASAFGQFEGALNMSTPQVFTRWWARSIEPYAHAFTRTLSGLEQACRDAKAFHALCNQFPHRHIFADGIQHASDLADLALVQWFLEPATPAKTGRLLLSESFDVPLTLPWTWHDPLGDCAYQVDDGLEIHAANGRDLWHINRSAPHVLYPLSDVGALDEVGFVFETVCGPAAEDRPTMGGLLLWLDETNYLRLDRGTGGAHEITFWGCVDNRDIVIGRGWLRADEDASAASSGRVVLRLEWSGGQVQALCSLDGSAWFTVGHIAFPFEVRAQIGVYAIGNIDRLIYHGAYPEGTAIRFTSVKYWALAMEDT